MTDMCLLPDYGFVEIMSTPQQVVAAVNTETFSADELVRFLVQLPAEVVEQAFQALGYGQRQALSLSSTEQIIVDYLAAGVGEGIVRKGQAWYRLNRQAAKAMGLTIRQLQKGVASLLDKGLIACFTKGTAPNSPRFYRLEQMAAACKSDSESESLLEVGPQSESEGESLLEVGPQSESESESLCAYSEGEQGPSESESDSLLPPENGAFRPVVGGYRSFCQKSESESDSLLKKLRGNHESLKDSYLKDSCMTHDSLEKISGSAKQRRSKPRSAKYKNPELHQPIVEAMAEILQPSAENSSEIKRIAQSAGKFRDMDGTPQEVVGVYNYLVASGYSLPMINSITLVNQLNRYRQARKDMVDNPINQSYRRAIAEGLGLPIAKDVVLQWRVTQTTQRVIEGEYGITPEQMLRLRQFDAGMKLGFLVESLPNFKQWLEDNDYESSSNNDTERIENGQSVPTIVRRSERLRV